MHDTNGVWVLGCDRRGLILGLLHETVTCSESPGTSSTSQRLVSLVLNAVRFFKSRREYPDSPEMADTFPVSVPVPTRFGLSRNKSSSNVSFQSVINVRYISENYNLNNYNFMPISSHICSHIFAYSISSLNKVLILQYRKHKIKRTWHYMEHTYTCQWKIHILQCSVQFMG